MGHANGLIRFLCYEEMQRLHEAALSILEDIGIWVDHPEALEYLHASGCIVNRNTKVVKFPKKVVENAVNRMQKDFLLANRQGLSLPMRYTEMYMASRPTSLHHDFTVNAGGFPAFVLDLDGNRRIATIEDVRDAIRLADALPNIDLIGLPCSAQEIPREERPVAMAAELVKNTSKPGGIEAWTRDDVRDITQIAATIRGGMDALKKKPFLVGYGELRSPLCIDHNMCEIFMEYVKMGIPQSLDTMPNAGATSPATSAGTLALGLAETLFGLVLGYAIDENALVSIDMNPSMMDMKTMIFPYSGADRITLMSAANQMMSEFYGRPGGCHAGKTDACYPGIQAGFEKALSVLFPVLTGATGIGTMGQLEGGITFSFVQLVIDDEIVSYIKRILRGFEVTNETLALDVIRDVGIGGNFLQHEHTALNFRKEFYLSDLLERMPWSAWDNQEVKGLEEKAREKARRIIREHQPRPLEAGLEKEINAIVHAARQRRRDL